MPDYWQSHICAAAEYRAQIVWGPLNADCTLGADWWYSAAIGNLS